MPGGFYSRGEIEGIVNKIRSPNMDFGAGKVFFVDGQAGSNGNPGDDPEKPLETITAALAKCVSYRGDYIIVLRSDSVAETHPILVEVDRVHIIGVTNKAVQTVAGYASGAAAGFSISAEHVEIAGLMLLADATHPGIELTNYCWGLWVHHCRFGTTLPTQDGIVKAAGAPTEGPVGGLIEDNIFGQEIQRDGIRLAAPTYTVIRNNLFLYHGGIGINITGGNFAEIFGNRFVGRNVTGDAITVAGEKGIVAHNWTAYQKTDGAGLNVPYTDNGTNHWSDNYVNNTLVVPA